MALVDEVQGRYAANLLIQLSNPGSPAATTLDSTRLGYAATDATAAFERITGVAYDPADPQHVEVACSGVLCYLFKRSGSTPGIDDSFCKDWSDGVKALAEEAGNASRFSPQTDATVTVTRQATTEIPDMDRSYF